MKVEIPFYIEQSVYLKNDIQQTEYIINRIILGPRKIIYLELMRPDGELFEVSELMVNTEVDEAKRLSLKKDED